MITRAYPLHLSYFGFFVFTVLVFGEEKLWKEEEEKQGRALGKTENNRGKKKTRLLTERKECFLGNAQMNGLSLWWTEKNLLRYSSIS